MRAIILAAGRGSRLKELTDDKPKCLVELKGKTLLSRQLHSLRSAGVSEIGIVTGYKRELLKPYGLHEFYNQRWHDTQMVSSLQEASRWLREEPCIVSYSDIFYDAIAVTRLLEAQVDIAVAYDPDWRKLWEGRFENPLLDAETFKLRSDGTLAEIGNVPDSIEEVEGQYVGLLSFTPEGWNVFQAVIDTLSGLVRDQIDLTSVLNILIQGDKIELHGVAIEGLWGEVDHPTDLLFYEET